MFFRLVYIVLKRDQLHFVTFYYLVFFSPGLSSLIYLPSTVWNVLLKDQGQENQQDNGQEQEQEQEQEKAIGQEKRQDWEHEQEIQELRVWLCSLHIQTRYITETIFSNFFFFSFLWRTFLILHADGFIHNGQLNIRLFGQLFWLLALTFITVAYTIFPGSMLLRGEFPKQSTIGKICLLRPIGHRTGKEVLKRNGMVLAAGFNAICFVLYFYRKAKAILKTLSPHNKMSCIGRYKRNAMDYIETAGMSLTFGILGIFDVLLVGVYKYLNLRPWTVFLLDFFIWVFLFETFSLALTFKIYSKEIPSFIRPQRTRQFYVRSPLVLHPRRPPDPLIPLLLPLERGKGYRRTPDPLKPLLLPSLRSEGKGRGKSSGKTQTSIKMQAHQRSSQHQGTLPDVN